MKTTPEATQPVEQWEATRIKNDGNGNSRYVVHFLAFITEADRKDADEYLRANPRAYFTTEFLYGRALHRARKFGGRKFHNKQYGGGIVFQCYGQWEINELVAKGRALKL